MCEKIEATYTPDNTVIVIAYFNVLSHINKSYVQQNLYELKVILNIDKKLLNFQLI